MRYRIDFRNPSLLARATGRSIIRADVKNDQSLFNEATLADGREVPRNAAYWRETLSPDGAIGNYRALKLDPKALTLFNAAQRSHLESGELELDWVRTLVTAARSTGAEVVAFIPPIEPVVTGQSGIDVTDYEVGLREALDGELRRLHVPALDVSTTGIDAASFADTAHLNNQGSMTISKALAAALAGHPMSGHHHRGGDLGGHRYGRRAEQVKSGCWPSWWPSCWWASWWPGSWARTCRSPRWATRPRCS